jgi:hypothetical protein
MLPDMIEGTRGTMKTRNAIALAAGVVLLAIGAG